MKNSTIKNVNKFSFIYSIVITAFIIISCSVASTTNVPSAVGDIENVRKDISDTASGLGDATSKIDSHVNDARKDTPKEVLPKLEPHYIGISKESGNIKVLKGKLEANVSTLSLAKENSEKLEKVNSELQAQVTKLEQDKKDALAKMMMWIIAFCVVGIGVSVALLYMGNTIGITTGIGCIATIATAIVVAQYSVWIAIVAGAVVIGGIVLLVIELYKRFKTGQQLVSTIEATKQVMPQKARYEVFGNGAIPGKIDIIQSENTQKFVKAVRNNGKIRLAQPTASTVTVLSGESSFEKKPAVRRTVKNTKSIAARR